MILHLSVSHSVHGGVAPLHAGIHTLLPGLTPPGRQCPPGQTLLPWADTPLLGRHHPEEDTPPGYYGIRSTSGRYTSYWKAYLFIYDHSCSE